MTDRGEHEQEGERGPAMSRVLAVGGDGAVLETVSRQLVARGYRTAVARGPQQAVELLRSEAPDGLILVLPVQGGARALVAALRAVEPRIRLLVCGSDDDVQTAADAFELGAADYLEDPRADAHRLLAALGLMLGTRRHDAHLRYLRQREAERIEHELVSGQCPAMQRIMGLVRHICRRGATGPAPTILITGETGTGKGVLARYLHYSSARRNQPFVELNCAALPAPLIEAELFGHERGSFTGAVSARSGLVETADGGTLFLDEIGTLPGELQAKLLGVIEGRQVRRIGARKVTQVDAQIIAATHRNMVSMVAAGEFREDLYHRLNVLSIELPPLRERGEDSVLLAEAFVETLCRERGLPARRLADDARQAIRSYPWPGNVRELKNVLERAIFLDDRGVITAEQLPSEGTFHRPGPAVASLPEPPMTASPPSLVAVDRVAPRGTVGVGVVEGRLVVKLPDGGVALEELEREVLREALARCAGNVSRAARFLSISRQTLIYRLRKHGLSAPGERPPLVLVSSGGKLDR